MRPDEKLFVGKSIDTAAARFARKVLLDGILAAIRTGRSVVYVSLDPEHEATIATELRAHGATEAEMRRFTTWNPTEDDRMPTCDHPEADRIEMHNPEQGTIYLRTPSTPHDVSTVRWCRKCGALGLWLDKSERGPDGSEWEWWFPGSKP
jgi:hypothetical protein